MPPAPAKPWSFYGRRTELEQLQQVLARGRWFFMQISGRRMIGKTALIQQALRRAGITRAFLARKMAEYDRLRAQIEDLKAEIGDGR